MTSAAIKIFHIALGTVTLAAGLLVSERASITRPDNIISNAAAIIGRPLTPLSYAGVARGCGRRCRGRRRHSGRGGGTCCGRTDTDLRPGGGRLWQAVLAMPLIKPG
jgi:hypothetical protein